MLGLMLILHIFIGATLSGVFVVAALVFGFSAAVPLVLAVALGFVAAFPVAWLVARAMHGE